MMQTGDDILAPARRPFLRWRVTLAVGAALTAAALAVAAVVSVGTSASAAVPPAVGSAASDGVRAAVPGWSSASGQAGRSGPASGYGSTAGGTTASTAAATAADAAESVGVVLIETKLGYQSAEAAGTGMVITSDGLVLTNNHVIEGSTAISVAVASTGATYDAQVVGTDVTDDVAVLRLDGASGLPTVAIDKDSEAVGDAVTAVGNAEGGGALMAASGSISRLDATVTTSSTDGVSGETLDGMIEIQADVVSGDSGGPLLDAEGEVAGMTTAASSGSAITVAYAIPIETAMGIVQKIVDGDKTGGVVLGYPAFLGISPATVPTRYGATRPGSSTRSATAAGVVVGAVYDGTPAAEAGLAAGDVITAVDGSAVASAAALSSALAGHAPGDAVTISWTDAAGGTHSATVILIAGPAA